MVRVKHRYLLGQILFPISEAAARDQQNASLLAASEPGASRKLPYVVSAHRPVPIAGFSAQDLRRLIVSAVLENFGEYGGGAATPALQVKYFSPATSTFIIRAHRDHHRLIWAAMTLITRLQHPKHAGKSSSASNGGPVGGTSSTPCVFQVVRVSGTIVKAEEEAIRRAREMVRRAQNEGAAASEEMMALVAGGALTAGEYDHAEDDKSEEGEVSE